MPTYLHLAPQQGGTRFGPFSKGVIQLGSDPTRCQIVLDAGLGIFAVHCLIQDGGNGTYSVMPTQANLKLWLLPSGEHEPQQITGACKAKVGDQVILGKANGPRFTLFWDGSIVEEESGNGLFGSIMGGMTGKRASGGSTANRVAHEFGRRSTAKLMTKNPLFRQLYQFRTRYGNGRWSSPTVIVSVLFGLFSLFGTGLVGCGTGALALWHQFF